MATVPNIPDPIRERLMAQQRRLRVVRISFAVTAVMAVALMFAAMAYQGLGLAPSAHEPAFLEINAAPGGEVSGLLLDRMRDLRPSTADRRGAFRFARLAGGKVTSGRQFEGAIEGAAVLGNRAVVLFREQMAEFDLTGEPGPEWPASVRNASLGITETDGSPRAVNHGGTLWLVWATGTELMARPLLDPEAVPAVATKLERAGVTLAVASAGNRLYVTTLERKTGRLSLYSFGVHIEEFDQQAARPAEGDTLIAAPEPAAPRGRRVVIEGTPSGGTVTGDVEQSSVAIVGNTPIVALRRRSDARREWELWRLQPPAEWTQLKQRPPVQAQNPFTLGGFMNLSTAGTALAALYSDGATVKLSLGTPEDGEFAWTGREFILEPTRGGIAPLIWLCAMCAMLVLLAGQGVWLLLNRQQEIDKTLASLIAAAGKTKAEKVKALPKLFYASHFARALALLIDLLVTSPVIILLKQVYGYEWAQAYGFLYTPMGTVDSGMFSLTLVQATLVTLCVLTAYSLFCELMWGRTLGKALLHMRVVNADGEAPAGWQIAVRNLLRIVELGHWLLLMIPLGLMFLSGKQQRLGDMLARTYVIVDVVPEEQADDIDIG